MFTIRTVGGAALFLFATTFIWLTPSFASRGISTKGPWWAASSMLAWATTATLIGATWGLFTRTTWWAGAAVAGAAVGIVASCVYWVAASRSSEAASTYNALIHVAGSAGVFVLLLVPALESWVQRHVSSGR